MAEVLSYVCPYCGCEVRVGKTCSGCAKKANKPKPRSWEQDQSKDGHDLPDDDFDYEKFVAREFGKSPHQLLGIKWYWWLLAMLLLAGMICGIIGIR
jgi:hypothetical protein